VELHHHRGPFLRAAAEDLAGVRKLGDLHLRRAQAGMGALGDDEYGRLIRNGLDRLAQLLSSR
jgi:hypothetical protein